MHKQRVIVLTVISTLALSLLVLASLSTSGRAQAPQAWAETATHAPVGIAASAPLSTSFTYQGQLKRGGEPVTADCSMAFRLYDQADGGVQVGSPLTPTVPVSDSLFTVQLDFGASAFTGDARWLGVLVMCPGDDGYTDLGRQPLTAAPYALYALVAPWSGLRNVPAGFADGVDDVSVVVSGTQVYAGEGLTQFASGDAVTLSLGVPYRLPQVCTNGQIAEWSGALWVCGDDDAGTGGASWALTGNAGTNPLVNFLGTTDAVSLTLAVNGAPALRLSPAITSPNVIGGHGGNWVGPGVAGASIGGGGMSGAVNGVYGDYGAIGGGMGNTAYGELSTVGGGDYNYAQGDYSVIAGGDANHAAGNHTFIGGGLTNYAGGPMSVIGGGESISVTGDHAFVGGGMHVTVTGNFAAVGGGGFNTANGYATVIGGGGGYWHDDPVANTANSDWATVGGGSGNSAGGSWATVGGGGFNTADGEDATVGGGWYNTASGMDATIGGGQGNIAIGVQASIGGGEGNVVTATHGTIAGGYNITVTGDYAAVGGGAFNTASGYEATVGGGGFNIASGDAAIVGGGWNNSASDLAATISGGHHNYASGYDATVGGGYGNQVTGWYATVSGGGINEITASGATVGGGASNLVTAPYGTIAGGYNITVTGDYAAVGGGAFNTASGYAAVIGGGGGYWLDDPVANTANGDWATVGGGSGNSASGDWATIGGGWNNTASDWRSTIGGGADNIADGSWATVGGGWNNTASGERATVGGGSHNIADGRWGTVGGGYNNTTNGECATVGGGSDNIADNSSATVGGGRNNTASGLNATIPGGFGNVAQGYYSFAAGRRARALHQGTFVWADSTDADFDSTGNDQFRVRANGGLRMYTGGNSAYFESTGGNHANSTLVLYNIGGGSAAYMVGSTGSPLAEFDQAGAGPVLDLQNNGDVDGNGGGNFITGYSRDDSFDLQFRITSSGQGRSDVGWTTPAEDFAEMLPAVAGLEPGDVLAIGPDGTLVRSTKPYQTSVVGVYSTQPGFIGGHPVEGPVAGTIPLAVVGILPVKVTTENGAILPGDLLVASSTPGHAMKAGPNPPQGTVIGKALERLDMSQRTGVIKMLATLQ
jgi:hypothetical protein